MDTLEQREKAVKWAFRMTENTRIAPKAYEQQLLAQFVQGMLTLDQVIEQLETCTGAANCLVLRMA